MVLRIILASLIACLMFACATQTGVNGGPKDEQAPVVLTMDPPNYSTQFRGGDLSLEFDEYVVVKAFNEQVLISPPLAEDIEYDIYKKTVVLHFPPIDSLLANTTYSIYLGDAIQDLNEGNTLDSNLFVFSTGDYLDSMSFSGAVVDAYTNKAIEKAYVLLYANKEDSIASKELASYITRTDKEGHFHFKFIAEGDYQIFALVDENRTRLFDQPSERFAFADSLVVLQDSLSPYFNLRTYKEAVTLQFTRSRILESYALLNLGFNMDVDSLSIDPITSFGDSADVRIERIEPDSFNVWMSKASMDSIWVQLRADDFVDTILADYKTEAEYNILAAESKKTDSLKLELKLNTKGRDFDYFDTLELSTNHPIDSVDWTRGMVIIDEDTSNLSSLMWSDRDGSTCRLFKSSFTWPQNASVKIILAPGCLKDMFGLSHDSIVWDFGTKSSDAYGSLSLNLDVHDSADLILDLLDKDGNTLVTYFVSPNESLSFPPLKPGKYGFRIVVDRDSNKEWTTGHYGSKRQPEPVYYYQEEVEVRANWELDLSWSIVD